jgi:hypothetical protein
MALPDPPVLESNQDSYMWRHWFRQLHDYITRAGQLGWSQLNFTGSNITSILSRDHNQLQGLQGGSASEKYHLTAAEYGSLSSPTGITISDAGGDTTTWVALVGTQTGTSVPVLSDGGLTYDSSTNALSTTTFVGALNGNVKLTGYTYTNLPTASAGMLAYVTDSTTAVWGANIAGGGANKVLAFYNGTNWTVAGK